ncbi:hypothetical protein Tco_0740341 [Tanacetum coccineum]
MESPNFSRTSPSNTLIRDPVLRLYHKMMAHSIAGEASGIDNYCLCTSIIDMTELVQLYICVELGDTWAWVPARLARQEVNAGGVTEEAPVALRGGDENEEMPHAVPPPPRTQGERIARLKEEVHGIREVLMGQREVLDSMARDFSRFTMWTVTSLAQMINRADVSYTSYSKSPVEYQRCIIR